MTLMNGSLTINGVDLSSHVVSVSWQPLSERTGYAQGYEAARAGESVAVCPFSPSDPEGRQWRQGWISGEQRNRVEAGTYDHTPDEYAVYKASIGWSDEALADPVVEILGGYDPLPAKEVPGYLPPELWLNVTVAYDSMLDAFRAAANAISNALLDIDFDALSRALLQGIEPAEHETPKERARRHEVALLAHHRRSHRRTNRWGPNPSCRQ